MCVQCATVLALEVLRKAFERFGTVEKMDERATTKYCFILCVHVPVTTHTHTRSAFISYSRVSCASAAVREVCVCWGGGRVLGVELICVFREGRVPGVGLICVFGEEGPRDWILCSCR